MRSTNKGRISKKESQIFTDEDCSDTYQVDKIGFQITGQTIDIVFLFHNVN